MGEHNSTNVSTAQVSEEVVEGNVRQLAKEKVQGTFQQVVQVRGSPQISGVRDLFPDPSRMKLNASKQLAG